MNITGNHDIGYAGELTVERLNRWERSFGLVNYVQDFKDAVNNTLSIIVLNSLNIDGPAGDESLREETRNFLNEVYNTTGNSRGILLLTHVPFSKPSGMCVDKPNITYWWPDGPIMSQNQISPVESQALLHWMFGPLESQRRKSGLILNGHDHEGCDVIHFLNSTSYEDDDSFWTWEEVSTSANPSVVNVGVREITVRSMMGDFNGNTGLISGWFDESDRGNLTSC